MTWLRVRRRTLAISIVALLLGAAACGDSGSGSRRGGAVSLPGPVPTGVAFHEPPEGAVTAPDFEVDLVDGTPLRASTLWAERPLVLLFTSSWCTHCAELHAELEAYVQGYDDAVALLAISGQDDHEALVAYVDQLRLDHPVALDADDAWLRYAVREPPLVALVAPGGHLVRGWPGGVEIERLEEEMEALFDR